jgi:large subunit ribosomal protein L28
MGAFSHGFALLPNQINLAKIAPIYMSRICAISGKGPQAVNSRSHSNVATRRTQKVNLQTVRINGRRIRIATSTLRTLKRIVAKAHGEIPTKREKKAAKKAALLAKKV